MTIQEIKIYLKQNKITYEELAQKSQLSISTIKKVFSGIAQYPRIDTIQKIEQALGLDSDLPQVLSEDEQKLMDLISQLTDDEVDELSNFVDFLISKRK